MGDQRMTYSWMISSVDMSRAQSIAVFAMSIWAARMVQPQLQSVVRFSTFLP
jgi:hypothetical protein